MKRGFTLMEVTLAMGIMAVGVLSIVGLYSFGYRESQQSREDVAGAAYAEAVLSALTTMCSSTEVTWTKFNSIESTPENGWGDYLDSYTWMAKSNPESQAKSAYSAVANQMPNPIDFPDLASASGLRPALVVVHEQNSPIVGFGFRAVKDGSWGSLMSMPLYYTEVRFQGDASK